MKTPQWLKENIPYIITWGGCLLFAYCLSMVITLPVDFLRILYHKNVISWKIARYINVFLYCFISFFIFRALVQKFIEKKKRKVKDSVLRKYLKLGLRIILLLLLCPYIFWVFKQKDHIGETDFIIVLISISVILPIITCFLIKNRPISTIVSLLLTPIAICIAYYIDICKLPLYTGARAWFPLLAIFVLGFTCPIWIVISIVFGALKNKKNPNESVEVTVKPSGDLSKVKEKN